MDENDLIILADRLPVVMARTEAPRLLGGIISVKSLANHDSLGTGPEGRFKIGNKVCYPTKSLLAWLNRKKSYPQRDN